MKRNFSNESASTKSMSRRAFLGGSAVAFGTVMLSSAMGACSAPETSEGRGAGASANSEQVLYELYDTDILIIGGALRGLMRHCRLTSRERTLRSLRRLPSISAVLAATTGATG